MKHTILFLSLLFSFSFGTIQAQSYKKNKERYDHRMYTPQPGDPYNPTVAGIASFFIPGLGQMVLGEPLRGLAFLGGSAACYSIIMLGAMENVMSDNNSLSASSMVGIAGLIGVYLWSILDAIKVAKVNNMYFQDMRSSTSMTIQLIPYIGSQNYIGKSITNAGISLKVVF